MPADLRGLPLDDKLGKMAKAFDEDNILDLASPGQIPSRFFKQMKDIGSDLEVPLKLTCTREECDVLINVSEATSLKEIEDIIKSIQWCPAESLIPSNL